MHSQSFHVATLMQATGLNLKKLATLLNPKASWDCRSTIQHWYLPVCSASSLSVVMTREKHSKLRGITLDAKGFIYMSQSSFHFESQTKAYMSSWSHCGTLCVSLYLVRQLAQPLIFQRPQHATDRIMNLSPAAFAGSHSAANTDCAFMQINLQTSRQCDNLSLIVLCVRGGVRQRCNVQRDSSEKGAGVRHRPKGMLAEDHGTGWSEKEIRLKTFIMRRLCLSSPIDLFLRISVRLVLSVWDESTEDPGKMRENEER